MFCLLSVNFIHRCDTANRYAKAVGEMCGGPWNIGGKCKCRLTCHKSKEIVQQRGDFFAYGKCMKVRYITTARSRASSEAGPTIW